MSPGPCLASRAVCSGYHAWMPEPEADPNLPLIRRVAMRALLAGIGITFIKVALFFTTQSVAVLSDALESVINIAAAGMMLYSIWFANRPADDDHPYGHGKIEFLAVGLEGWLILVAGIVIAYESVVRLLSQTGPKHLTWGLVGLAVVALLTGALATYVYRQGKKYDHAVLIADGKHLITDVASTFAVFFGLLLVKLTGKAWLDPVVAIAIASLILFASWRLLWQSIHGLMDRVDPEDDQLIREILDDEVTQGAIAGYHKVRHRHTGPFHWVDMHLHVPGDMSVREGHTLASRIEHRIEQALGQGNATAHLEPAGPEQRCEAQIDAPTETPDGPPDTQQIGP